jgi:hypothetical protein
MQPQPPRPNRYVFDDACPQDSAHDPTMARTIPLPSTFIHAHRRSCTAASTCALKHLHANLH